MIGFQKMGKVKIFTLTVGTVLPPLPEPHTLLSIREKEEATPCEYPHSTFFLFHQSM